MEERCHLHYWLYGKGGFDIYPIIYDPMPVRVRMKITTEELLGNIQTSRIRRGKNCKKVVKSDHFCVFARRPWARGCFPWPFLLSYCFHQYKTKLLRKKFFLCLPLSRFRLTAHLNKTQNTHHTILIYLYLQRIIFRKFANIRLFSYICSHK